MHRKRKMTFIGHVVREGGLEHDALTGMADGKRGRREREREEFMDGLTRIFG